MLYQSTIDTNEFLKILKFKSNGNKCYFIVNKDIQHSEIDFLLYKGATLLFSNLDNEYDNDFFSFCTIYRNKKENGEEGLITFNIKLLEQLLSNGSITALYTSNNKPDKEIYALITIDDNEKG